MNKEQIKLYSVDTKAFYTMREDRQDKAKLGHNKMLKFLKGRTEIQIYLEMVEDLELLYDDILSDEEYQDVEIDIDEIITKKEFNTNVRNSLSENELYQKI